MLPDSESLITSLIPPPISQASAQLRGQDVPVWQGQFQVLMTCLNQTGIYSKLLFVHTWGGGRAEGNGYISQRDRIRLQQPFLLVPRTPGSL